jgi:hypothetical protein
MSHTPIRTPSPSSNKKQKTEDPTALEHSSQTGDKASSSKEDMVDTATSANPSVQAGPSANDDAATHQAPPRVIDENTDMSTLTDQEIMRLMEGMDHTENVLDKVGYTVPLFCSTTSPATSPDQHMLSSAVKGDTD